MTWAIDLDGVLWRGGDAIPGSAEAVAALRHAGHRVVFLTNNSYATVAEYVAKLEEVGVPCGPEDLLTSAQAAGRMLKPGQTALVCGGPGVEEALRARGVETVREGEADAVVVGWHDSFDFGRLTAAVHAVLGGARLIGTNDDATYPTPDGVVPGGGSLLAAVAYASSATPEVAGKPHPPMVDLLADRVGDVEVVVGDRPNTDGLLARRLGVPFALVLTGVTSEVDDSLEVRPDEVGADLAEVVSTRLGSGGAGG